METCKDLFIKCIKTLENYNNFENYYDFLKSHHANNSFCEYYFKDKQEVYSYKDFFEKVENLTAFFHNELSGFSENSWVGIKLANHPYYLAVYFALLKNNFNVILLDNKGSADYFNYVIKNSKMVAIVTDEPFESDQVKFINFKSAISSNLKLSTNASPKKFGNKVAFCTSGTTGYFNIVVYTGKQVLYQLKSLLSIVKESPIKDFSINIETKFLVSPPLHHIFGFIMHLTYSLIGITNVMSGLTLTDFINTVKNRNIEIAAAVPLIWEALINFMKGKYKNENAATLRELLGENLKFCICGGAHVSSKVIKLFNEAQIAFSECYGMTEAGMISLNIGQLGKERMDGSVGNIKNATCVTKVITSEGKILDEGLGELIISGPGLYVSTLKNGVEIPRDVSKGGFIKTGDLVEIKNGNIYFRDRIKDVIINSTGENICPGELEKHFDFLLENNVQFTILGIDNFPVIVISLKSNGNFTENHKETLINKIIAANKKLPLNKKIVTIYFTEKPFPITSAMKVRKFFLKKCIEENPKDYVKVDLINKNVKKFSIEEIKSDLRTFFSTYLNLNMSNVKNESLIVEELNVDSLIIAELFIYIEEKYDINIEQEFMLSDSLSINIIANLIFEKV